MNADNSDGEDLKKVDNNDGKYLQNADNSDGKNLQNADNDNGGKDVHDSNNNDGEDLHSADNDDGQDMPSTDYSDGEDVWSSSYIDDEDLENTDYEIGGYLNFEQMYRCYPVSFLEKDHLEIGDKVIMPQSALRELAYFEIDYPMLFELSNPSTGKVTHCGVLEFTAGEGIMYLPGWMMEGMPAKEGDFVLVKYSNLSKGTYVKMQPHTMDFLSISNPKAVLERTLRSYSCLTTGGTIVIDYNDKKFYVDILETKPSPAVCIIDTDCEVEFAPPLDYKEPEKPANSTKQKVDEELEKKKQKFIPFSGSARRLDGKPSTQLVEPVSFPLKQCQPKNGIGTNDSTTTESPPIKQRSASLVFCSDSKDASNGKEKISSKVSTQDPPQMEEEKKFKAFTGKKYLLDDSAGTCLDSPFKL